MPTVFASCIGSRWSGPPGDEPPPTAMPFGLAFQAVTRSSIVLYGESFGTTMAPASSISLASGVVWVSVAFDLEVYEAPTTPSPICMASLPLPFSFTVRWRPTVPPAPGRLKTCTPVAILASSITLAAVRAVVSYPPPGVFGTMIRRPVTGLPSPPDAGLVLVRGGAAGAQGQRRGGGDAHDQHVSASCHHVSLPFRRSPAARWWPPGGHARLRCVTSGS